MVKRPFKWARCANGLRLDGVELEVVNEFKYLGSIAFTKGKVELEVRPNLKEGAYMVGDLGFCVEKW